MVWESTEGLSCWDGVGGGGTEGLSCWDGRGALKGLDMLLVAGWEYEFGVPSDCRHLEQRVTPCPETQVHNKTPSLNTFLSPPC